MTQPAVPPPMTTTSGRTQARIRSCRGSTRRNCRFVGDSAREGPGDPLVAHGHGRRARARGAPDARRRRVSAPRSPSLRPVPRPDEQLDVHAARSVCAPRGERHRRAGEGDLDLGARDRGLPREPAPARVCLRDRRGGITTALHAVGYTLTERDPDTSSSARRVRTASSASRQAIRLIPPVRASSRRTRTRRARRRTARCLRQARSPR